MLDQGSRRRDRRPHSVSDVRPAVQGWAPPGICSRGDTPTPGRLDPGALNHCPSGHRRRLDAMRHKTVDLDGPVHYLDYGGEGTPLLMVHGLGGNALNWMAVGPQMANDYHAIAIDLAGFGRTPLFHRSASVGANANLVHSFIEQVIGEPVLLMGNSMGGHISILEAA